MSKESYREKLLSPLWQRKRLEILDRDEWKCRHCGKAKEELHVHHRAYISGREPWEHPDWCYVTLCEKCHENHDDTSKWEETLGWIFDGKSLAHTRLADRIRNFSEKRGITQGAVVDILAEVLFCESIGSPLSVKDAIERFVDDSGEIKP